MKHLSLRFFRWMAFGVIAAMLIPMNLIAQWVSDPTVNTVVCSTVNQQLLDSHIASDGSGGALIVWSDRNVETNDYEIYVQRISSNGNRLWAENGLAIGSSPINQNHPEIAGDGSGGAFVTWFEARSGKNIVLVQKISAEGLLQWNTEGVPVGAVESNFQQSSPVIVSDGNGGAIIAWDDWRGDLYNGIRAEYAQRINADGVPLWGIGGVSLHTPSSYSIEAQQIMSDGNGGAIVAWHSYIGSYPDGNDDIFAQKVNAAGSLEWGTEGVAVCSLASFQLRPKLADDGNHGAIIVWEDFRNNPSKSNLYAQKVNTTGTIQWAADGIPVALSSYPQLTPEIVSDGSGGVFVTWKYSTEVVTAQRLTSEGANAWEGSGLDLGASGSNSPQIISDGSSGAIITWYDNRGSGRGDIYAQRITGNGSLLWNSKAVGICTDASSQNSPQITSDGYGGAIIAWMDERNSATKSTDIYAQQVSSIGTLGSLTGLLEASSQTALGQNYPNPAKSFTQIRYKVTELGFVSLKIYNEAGKEVYTLVDSKMSPGNYTANFEVTGLPGGTYICRLQTAERTDTKSLIVIK